MKIQIHNYSVHVSRERKESQRIFQNTLLKNLVIIAIYHIKMLKAELRKESLPIILTGMYCQRSSLYTLLLKTLIVQKKSGEGYTKKYLIEGKVKASSQIQRKILKADMRM